ncbi:AraC family transcriptional regulator [Streptomyces sp. B6B3]|uniref:AraC family transcriptional regulator n=1 Tax=Streptomyces sp. B6B3 TaxID=3153570 RepID=UPI00325C8E81
MDALTTLLDGPRARGAFLMRVIVDPPWGVRVMDEAPVTVVCVARGGAYIVPDAGSGAEPVRLGPGDVAVVRGPAPYTAADDPGTPPQTLVTPGGCGMSLDGRVNLCEEMSLGARTWGTGPDGATALLIGTYQVPGEIGGRLLRALPPVLALRADEWESALLPLLGEEIVKDGPGQEIVLDRLLDLLLISVLRAWFAGPRGNAPGWFRAHGDPVVGPALRLLHEHPAHPWTVAALAARAGASRAGLARRFASLVGEPPMTYLTNWRLELAADLLREPGLTLEAVARRVGYGSAFALSAAFKRERGVSPSEHRVG